MDLILRPNCCLLDLHSNDTKSLKSFFLTQSYSSINITLIQQHHLIKNIIKEESNRKIFKLFFCSVFVINVNIM